LDIRRGLIGFAVASEGIIPKARTFTLRGEAARLGDFERLLALDFDLVFLGDFDRETVLRLGVIVSTASATAAPTIIPGAGRGAIMETTSGFWSIPSITAAITGFLETRFEDIRLGDLETLRLGDLETLRLGDLETLRLGDLETLRLGDLETLRLGDLETLRLGDLETLRLGTRGDTAPAAIFTGRVTTATVALRTDILRLGDFDRETRLGLLEALRLGDMERLGDLEREGIFILVYK
jgi:hypothetical protein